MIDDTHAGVRGPYIFGLFSQSLGTGMVALTSSFLIFQQTGRVLYVAMVMVMTNVPQLALAPVANRLAHRWGGPRLYVASWGTAYAWDVVPFVLWWTGDLTADALLAWYLVQGVVIGLGTPAAGMVRTELAPPGGAAEFNASATRALASASMLGILVGGVALNFVGPGWIYLVAALSGVPVVVAVLRLCRTPVATSVTTPPQLSTAFALQRTNPELRAAFRFTMAIFLLAGYAVTLPAIASRIGDRPIILSSLQAAGVFGGLFVVVGARIIHRRTTWLAVQRICVAVIALAILYLSWVAFRDHQPIWYLATAVLAIVPLGFALNLDSAILNAAVQVTVPAASRAPVLTAYALVPVLAVPIGEVVIGGISDFVSVTAALAAVGGGTLLALLVSRNAAARAAVAAIDGDLDEPPFQGGGAT